ncbi:MAG: CDP-glycerol glycerophosphotransferase family protein [Oscillospiraceae bacterium]|nr:CDP-glycerol glycerophosphotransferase family protein [Oscillospiraceae bacterium]
MIKMKDKSEQKKISAKLLSVRWERIYLYMEIKLEQAGQADSGKPEFEKKPLDFYMLNAHRVPVVKLQVSDINGDVYTMRLNITNDGANRCVPLGTYNIAVCRDEDFYAFCEVDMDRVDHLDQSSKNFLYSSRARVFVVTFFAYDDNDRAFFQLHITAAERCKTDFREFPKMYKIILNFFKSIFKYILNTKLHVKRYYKFKRRKYDKKPPLKKTVLFMTEQTDTLGANLTAVIDRMRARGMDRDYQILTSARTASSNGKSVGSWLKLAKKVAKSDIVVLDDHVSAFDWMILSKKTKIIQLWHAGAGFKSSGYSRWGRLGCPPPASCHRQYAYGIAGSKHIAPFFSEVWGINDEQTLPTGMPRMDKFLDPDYRAEKTAELCAQFPFAEEKVKDGGLNEPTKGKKIILFAPTYRGRNRREAYYPYNLIDFDMLYETCGDKYVVLFKVHPWVDEGVPIPEKYADKFIDVGNYPDINDLFYITDLLITDYSSNIYEYSLMLKPMLFYAFDKTAYSFSRGFHRDYEEAAPGKVCYNFNDLITAIKNEDFDFEKVDNYIAHHFDNIDSKASDRVIDWLIKGDIPENLQKAIKAKEREIKRLNQLDFSCLIDAELATAIKEGLIKP